ncbi:uncharacterized protein LOC6578645 isoform X2 [Drosophila mojavensis]|uniref:Uncharacterized protein, isoform B n=1 Tax=Drosophila mojavensis TaxID=7230 RepID=A0A0Q9XKB8_DROMO|nr:uncharacterized protein LOC6578645 isoform X2 [Drosophila mojavensis]KRG04147.1 uncharacterized protein Dmoj_GI19548, isoform B [Drosophila mojavensis]
MDSSSLLIILAVVCFCLFIIRSIMIAYRFYMLKQLKEMSQGEQARREMEISVTNNNTNMGNGSVCLEVDNNDMTILPKGMDLPPSYDELNICNKDGNLGASTLTITTDLGCSNPNLIAAAALNEPPPHYQGTIDIVEAPTTATTISTTTVVSVAPRI